ncbi:restriction endonuclease subunit S, partial [Roseateles sp. GG27B]
MPETGFPAIKRYRIFSDDIFISVAGSLGIVGKVPKELDGANLTENADRITNIKCSQDFLLHVLMSPLIQNVIDAIQTVGAQPKLALTRIRKFIVPQPPLPEQRAIAAALSDVDALLAGLDRLIAKKRDLKQAAMQQLLTGQTRLPGFEGDWQTLQVGTIADVKTGPFGSSLHESDYVHDGIPIITVEHLGEFGVTRQNLPMVSGSDWKRLQSYSLEIGDIVFSRVGSVDRNALIKKAEEGWLFSGRLLRVRPDMKRVFPPFLSYQFHTERFKNLVLAVAVGQTM